MRSETYEQGTGRLLEVTEVLRVAGIARYRREKPPGIVVEDRAASLKEAQMLAEYERLISPPVNWRALWLAADTAAKKIAVLAKRLELE